MADPREEILKRLVVVIAAAVGSGNVARNETRGDDADADDNPIKSVVVLEGEEVAAGEADGANRHAAAAGGLMNMRPQVWLSNYDSSSEVGTGLSALRAAIIKAVVTDSALNALTHRNTGGRYIGMGDADLSFAGDALGRMALRFQFTYSLIPSEL